ncbi:hypothetical protein RND71_032739 [Anisodus tanguticus]|uniref:Uncharacterized protein n=1 Tax=Anisodus tanguticus TaxID=243964 RepID=A0AAE1R6J7_9SOLA|nr:hypothetical protein RND71_032739 [Anisodus tanguticus]
MERVPFPLLDYIPNLHKKKSSRTNFPSLALRMPFQQSQQLQGNPPFLSLTSSIGKPNIYIETELLVAILKRETNRKFSTEIEAAVVKYTKALDLCPLKLSKERIVLYSNRAQCHLILGKAELAISDTTPSVCLSGEMRPKENPLLCNAHVEQADDNHVDFRGGC